MVMSSFSSAQVSAVTTSSRLKLDPGITVSEES